MTRRNPLPIQVTGVVSLHGIADALNARGTRTARGSTWHATTVRNMLLRQEPA